MLKKDFAAADIELMKYLLHRQPNDGKTWLEFCRERDFTVDQLMAGFERYSRRINTIEHDPIPNGSPKIGVDSPPPKRPEWTLRS